MAVSVLDVLVVDDSLDSAELLAELLESYGHRVRSARTGAQALELVAERLPALLFLDLTLPDMTGEDVARSIRTHGGATCRIVALTGHSAAQRRDAALAAGCDGFLVKPLRVAQLEHWLNESAESSS